MNTQCKYAVLVKYTAKTSTCDAKEQMSVKRITVTGYKLTETAKSVTIVWATFLELEKCLFGDTFKQIG